MSKVLNFSSKLHIAISVCLIICDQFLLIDSNSTRNHHHHHHRVKSEYFKRPLNEDREQDSMIIDTNGGRRKFDIDDGNFVSQDESPRVFDQITINRVPDADLLRNYSKNMYSSSLDEYKQRVMNIFQLIALRPTQGCNTDPRRVFRFYCPTPHPQHPETGWVCIKIDDLCNTIPDCPGAEDEDPTHCMYYVSTQKQMVELKKVLMEILRRPDQVSNGLNMEINSENSLAD